MKIYNYLPSTGQLVSVSLADESPLEPGVWLLPAYSTEIKPPKFKEGEMVFFRNGEWVKEPFSIVEVKEEEVPEVTPYYAELRRRAYVKEADPLFFMAARKEATKQEWLDKIKEIKERYPK